MANRSIPTDEDLVRSAQQGALDAFTAIYERYLPIVYGRVRSVIPETDVEDVTQEIFIAVMRSLNSFRYEARFATWLRTLVNRQVADYYRCRKPDHTWISIGDDNDEDPERFSFLSVEDDVDARDDEIILRQGLMKLPENYREIILLRFVDGLQFDEIARLQGQSLEATKSLFRRAVVSLQKRVAHV